MKESENDFPLWVRAVDLISGSIGKSVGYLLALAPAILLAYEVVARYVFNSPTRFTIELGLISQVLLAAAVGGYVLRENGHVNMDLLVDGLREPWNRVLLVIGYLAGAVLCGLLAWLVWRSAMWSMTVNNVTETLGIRKAPLELAFTAGMVLLALQFLAEARKRITLRNWVL
ncbi:MAG: TRAP transporter small permease [Mesorhizobium sp.]|nr:TRAP transporter small permease [Mesorhizobium sp.]